MKPLRDVLAPFQIVPKQTHLYETAFTHPSYNGEANTHHQDYERLEFIGDSVVNFIVADLIYHTYPSMREGQMTKIRASLVQREALAKYARELHLGEHILLSSGLKHTGGYDSHKILEDVFEAFMGAVYLDQGFEPTYRMLTNIFLTDIQNFDENQITDYKTRLQEEMQADKRGIVHYEIVSTKGPAHAPTFEAEVYYNDICLGRGSASSKKEAEQMAAKDALQKKAV